jgi:hypothetical protein
MPQVGVYFNANTHVCLRLHVVDSGLSVSYVLISMQNTHHSTPSYCVSVISLKAGGTQRRTRLLYEPHWLPLQLNGQERGYLTQSGIVLLIGNFAPTRHSTECLGNLAAW